MKNLKNIAVAAALTATLGFGATAAKAGILMGDRAQASTTCTTKKSTTLKDIITGFIMTDFPELSGLLLTDRSTMKECKDSNGFIMTDGLLLTD